MSADGIEELDGIDELVLDDFAILWQTKMRPGEYFCVLCWAEVIVYGVVLGRLGDAASPKGERWVRVWSELQPDGSEMYIRMAEVDLPLTKEQFMLAKKLKWPGTHESLKAMMNFQRRGDA